MADRRQVEVVNSRHSWLREGLLSDYEGDTDHQRHSGLYVLGEGMVGRRKSVQGRMLRIL